MWKSGQDICVFLIFYTKNSNYTLLLNSAKPVLEYDFYSEMIQNNHRSIITYSIKHMQEIYDLS